MDGAMQVPISEFEASTWHNSRVCVWYFQVCKFQSCLLAKYFISANSCSCTADEEKLRTDPLLCLKFSTWAGLKHLWDFITDTLTRSRFYRWVQNQTASGVFGANGSFELKQFNTTDCHIVRCQHRETRFWEFPTFQSSLAKGRWWGSPKRALAWELESHYLGFRQRSTIPFRFGGCLILSSTSISKTSKVSSGYMASSIKKKCEKLPCSTNS